MPTSDIKKGPLYVDSTNNRIGVGTSSPSANLEISSDSPTLRIKDTDTALSDNELSSQIEFYQSDAAGAGVGASIGAYGQGSTGLLNLRFATGANSEAMRIDSNRNLLVAKTASNVANVGFEAKSDGAHFMTRDSGEPLKINLLTNDGNLIAFAKNGGSVGSIGTDEGTLYIGRNDTGVIFEGFAADTLVPYNPSTKTIRDDTINLGYNNSRFKDLYLSGGVVFGDAGGSGTSSSNTLDSYEEGFFTPYYEPASGSFSSITYDSITNGYYTKIGNRVFIEGRIRTDALTVGTAAGALYLNGLPFAANISAGAISVGYTATWAGNSARMGYFNGNTRVYLADTPTSTGNAGTLNVTDMATGANSNYLYFSGHYRA